MRAIGMPFYAPTMALYATLTQHREGEIHKYMWYASIDIVHRASQGSKL